MFFNIRVTVFFIFLGIFQNYGQTIFRSTWDTDVTQTWVGGDFWANRLQDWRVAIGGLECVAKADDLPMRTVHLLTQGLSDRDESFRVTVRTGLLGYPAKGTGVSWSGFLIGAGNNGIPYQSAALIHHSSGKGGGIIAGIDSNGQLFFRSNEDESATNDYPILPLTERYGNTIERNRYNANWEDIQLKMEATPMGEGRYQMILSAEDFRTGVELQKVVLKGVSKDLLIGNIALVSHSLGFTKANRYWFRDLQLFGPKWDSHEDRKFGPIVNSMYNLNRSKLHLNVQFPPLGFGSGNRVSLLVRKDTADRWRKVKEERIDPLICQALPDVFWFEATNTGGTSFRGHKISQVPATTHVNSQGFEKAQIVPGGRDEIIISGNHDIYVIEIPSDPLREVPWPTHLIAKNTSDEGIGIGDIDLDGDLDIVCGRSKAGGEEPRSLVWFENPGGLDTPWEDHFIDGIDHAIDRIRVADLDNDGEAEIIVTEERYPGKEPDAHVWWFSKDKGPKGGWKKTLLARQYSTNNLDVVDIDRDGDLDIITAEHKGSQLELQCWENDGRANFKKRVLDTGKENHLGAQCFDMDGDGDLDIIGSAWDSYQYMHLWRNNEEIVTKDATEPHQRTDTVRTSMRTYQNREHFIIETQKMTYYYDIQGGGFSRIIDSNGNDWVGYGPEGQDDYPAGASGAFRGLPNLVYQGEDNGVGHPGFSKCRSWVENGILYSESIDRKWKWKWTFFRDCARFDLLKTDEDRKYWFLYEGIPGGNYRPGDYFYGTDGQGSSFDTPDFAKGKPFADIFHWVYVGDVSSDQTFYMLQLTGRPQTGIISYLGNSEKGVESKVGMTVIGFGRDTSSRPLLQGNLSFLIGLYPHKISNAIEHMTFKRFLLALHK